MIMTMMNYIYIDRNKRILQRMVPSSTQKIDKKLMFFCNNRKKETILKYLREENQKNKRLEIKKARKMLF